MPSIVIAVLAVGWAVTGVLYVFRIKDARSHIEFLSDARDESIQEALDAEKRATASQTELEFLRQTLTGLIQRPAVAVLTNDHIQGFANIVQSIVHPDTTLN